MHHVCHVDGTPCEVVRSVRSRIPRKRGRAAMRLQEALEQVSDCLPCDRCREAAAHCQALRGTRLGKHERNILLYAPGPEYSQGAILDPVLKTHAERETYLRAIRKLGRAGLLRVGRRLLKLSTSRVREDGKSVTRSYAHKTMQLTELGKTVREFYKEEMENERPIRWKRHLPDIIDDVYLPEGQLVALYARCLEKRLREFSQYGEDDSSDEAREARKLVYLLSPIVDELLE